MKLSVATEIKTFGLTSYHIQSQHSIRNQLFHVLEESKTVLLVTAIKVITKTIGRFSN